MFFLLSKTSFSFEDMSRSTELHDTSLISHFFLASDISPGYK